MLDINIWGLPASEFNALLARYKTSNSDTLPIDISEQSRSWIWALSGGGSRGAFQLGVALNIADHSALWPAGIAGTSIGSVNALLLAQGYLDGVRSLQKTWLQVQSNFDVAEWSDWIKAAEIAIDPARGDGFSLLSTFNPRGGGTREQLIPSRTDLLSAGDMVVVNIPVLGGIAATIRINDIQSALDDLEPILVRQAKGVFNVSGLLEVLNAEIDWAKVERTAMPLRISAVCLEDGNRYSFTEDRRAYCFPYFDQNSGHSSYESKPGDVPEIVALRDTTNYFLSIIQSAVAVPLLFEPGFIGFMDKEIVDPDTPPETTTAWTMGPMVAGLPPPSEPVNFKVFTFVDGGVRETLPTMGALQMLDMMPSTQASGVLSVGAGAFGSPMDMTLPKVTFGENGINQFTKIPTRALGLAIDEVANSDRERLRDRTPGSSLELFPSFDVGGLSQIDPGLTQIQLAYGFMTSFDVLKKNEARLTAAEYAQVELRLWYSTNKIAALRYQSWQLEQNFYLNFWHNNREDLDFHFGRNYLSQHPEYFDYADRYRNALTDHENPVDDVIDTIGDGYDAVTGSEVEPSAEIVLQILDDDRTYGTEIKFRDQLDADIRALKQRIYDEVLRRVETWGLDSMPSPYDMTDQRSGNTNALSDWWREFERHGWHRSYDSKSDPHKFYEYPTGPGWNDISAGLALQGQTGSSSPGFFFRRRPNENERPIAKKLKLQRDYSPWTIPGLPAVDKPGEGALLHRAPDYCAARIEGFAGDAQFSEGRAWMSTVKEWFSPDDLNHFLVLGDGDFGVPGARLAGDAPSFSIIAPSGKGIFLRETGLTDDDILPLYRFRSNDGATPDDLMTTKVYQLNETVVTTNNAYRLPSLVGYVGNPKSTAAREILTVKLSGWFDHKRLDSRLTAKQTWQIDG